MFLIKNLANMITVSRLLCAVILIFFEPFSLFFWILYVYCGVSDLADGMVARLMNKQSDVGAKLDSIADAAVFLVILIIIIPIIIIPVWIWYCMVVVLIIRITTYLIGYIKYQEFSALHTYANKATGALVFCVPVLYTLTGVAVTGIVLCFLSFLSACEELLITVLSKDLNRNRKSLFGILKKE